MLEHDVVWRVDPTASSVGSTFAPQQLPFPPTHSVLFCQSSTLASTQSFSFQTAQESTGPWVIEASTAIAANGSSASAAVLRVIGPYKWFRPVLNSASTGTYTLTFLAVR